MVEMVATGLGELVSPQKSEKFAQIADGMYKAFFTTRLSMFGSGLTVVLVILALLALAYLCGDRVQKARAAWFAALSTLGFAAFYIFNIFTYAYIFKGQEALGLSNYNRYIYPYYIGWMLAALALLGNILLSVAFYAPDGSGIPAGDMDQVGWFIRHAHTAAQPWLKAAFIFLLVGYGTKMGLAPLHNWLPDAHSQAPSLVSALLSGALLNCALLGILRGHQIMLAADLGDFSGGLLVFFGLLSLITAAIFIVGQGHYKRLLAYSSVEHMGILALGAGLGGLAAQGALLHAVCHSLTKCMLFLLAGNILARYHTFSSYDIRGLRWTMPVTGALWTAGFLAVAGSPPFGIFVSEFLILKGMLAQDSYGVAAAYLTALAVIFVGMSVAVLRMVQGNRPPDLPRSRHETLLSVLPPLALCLAILTLGLWVPDRLWHFLQRGAALIDG